VLQRGGEGEGGEDREEAEKGMEGREGGRSLLVPVLVVRLFFGPVVVSTSSYESSCHCLFE